MQKFNDKIEESDWSASNSIRQWYKTFLEDYQAGKLTAVTNAGTTTCTKNENEQPVVNATSLSQKSISIHAWQLG